MRPHDNLARLLSAADTFRWLFSEEASRWARRATPEHIEYVANETIRPITELEPGHPLVDLVLKRAFRGLRAA
jgi:hypothetical protein